MIYFRRDLFWSLRIIKDAEELSPAFLRYISLLVCNVCLRERYYKVQDFKRQRVLSPFFESKK